jgi:calcium-dependent protein kinase
VLTTVYDHKCDIWSCGVIFYVFLTGRLPFKGKSEAEILRKVKEGIYDMSIPEFRRVSREAKQLVQLMLTKDPANRPDAH